MAGTAHVSLGTLCSSAFITKRRTAPPAAVAQLDVRLSLRERAAVLTADVTRILTRGAQLESRTATVAVVVYPGGQLNRVAHLLMTFMMLGLGLFAGTAGVEHAKSSRVMVTVDECGNVTRRAVPR